MSYVVRDHRSVARWTVSLAVSTGVVVLVCVAGGRWWVAAVGVPLSLVLARGRIGAETTPLTADDAGIALGGRWTGWDDVDEVVVSPGEVRLRLDDQAPLPSWVRGRVTGGAGDDGVWVSTRLRTDPRLLLDGVRSQAPPSVRVRAAGTP